MMGQPPAQTPGALAQQMQPQGQQQMQGPQMAGGMQQGGAPNQMPQQRPGMTPGMPANYAQFYQQITPQQIQAARANNERLAALSDDQIRNAIIQSMHQKQLQKQQAGALQQGMRQPQQQSQPQPQQQQPNQPQMNPMAAMAQQTGPSQQNAQAPAPAPAPKAPTPQLTPAQAAVSNKQGATDSKAAGGNARHAANNSNNNRGGPNKQTAQSPAAVRKNLKRPSPDDAADAAANNSQPSQPQQNAQDARPAMPAKPGQISPEQLALMTPEQRARYEQVKRAHEQQAADMERLKQIGQEEHRNSRNEVMAEVAMNAQERNMMGIKLQKLKADMGKIGRVLGKWYGSTRDEGRARDYFRTVRHLRDP